MSPAERPAVPLSFLRRRQSLACCHALACGGLLLAQPAEPAPAGAPGERLRLGFTYSMFTGINENDAKASIKALATVIARERGIPADPAPSLFAGTDALVAAVRAGEVDAVGMVMAEFWAARRDVAFDRLLCAVRDGDPSEEYVVLVHAASGVNDLAALRGRQLVRFDNARVALAAVWLELELARAGLPPLARHFGHVTAQKRLARAVLPVFFRQADACLVTQHGFATMLELNPQLGAQLRVLARSPRLVPSLFALRAGFSGPFKERTLREFAEVHRSAAGQQALMIFQVGQVREHSLAELQSTLDLLDEFARQRPELQPAFLAALRQPSAASPEPK